MNIFKEGEFIMKKFILTLFVLSSIGIFANDEIIKQPLIIWRYRSKKWINNVTRELN